MLLTPNEILVNSTTGSLEKCWKIKGNKCLLVLVNLICKIFGAKFVQKCITYLNSLSGEKKSKYINHKYFSFSNNNLNFYVFVKFANE